MSDLLSALNDAQKAAVTAPESHYLVLAEPEVERPACLFIVLHFLFIRVCGRPSFWR